MSVRYMLFVTNFQCDFFFLMRKECHMGTFSTKACFCKLEGIELYKGKQESKFFPGKIQPLEMWSCPDSEKIIVSRFDEGFIALTF